MVIDEFLITSIHNSINSGVFAESYWYKKYGFAHFVF